MTKPVECEPQNPNVIYKPIIEEEPIRMNRFYVDFGDIESYLFQEAKQISEKTYRFKILALEKESINEYLNKMKMNILGGEKIDININILDPTGKIIKKVILESCKITDIKSFEEFDYQKDDLMFHTVDVLFENKKIQ